MLGSSRFSRRARSDRGAALVEFALLMPFLLLLVLGIVEFGFFLGEWNELKHGAHQGARLAAVNDNNLLVNTCTSINLHDNTSVTVDFELTGGTAIGDQGTVTLDATVSSLSGLGFVEALLPGTISAYAEFRLEQIANAWDSLLEDGTCP